MRGEIYSVLIGSGLSDFAWCSIYIYIQGAAEKSSPLKFLAVFSAIVWNFNLKFYTFIYGKVLHLTAKRNMIMSKNDKIIGF